MKKKAKKLSKAKLWSIISASILALAAIAIIILNVFIPVKYLASFCVGGSRFDLDKMRVSFVDVGLGDCSIIELPDGKNMLVDAGDGSYTNNSKILKELNRRDIDVIDYLICSSVNGWRCGGLAEVIKYKKIKTVFMPYCTNKYVTDGFCGFSDAVKSCGAEIIYNEYNTGVTGNGYFFKFLSPSVIGLEGGEYDKLNSNPTAATRNNSSAVIWLEYGETAFMFAGDAEKSVLESIVLSYGVSGGDYPAALEKCKIVKVANHGNPSSACAVFYDTLSPETGIISVGENGAGCPSIGVMSDVINSVGQNLYRTDEHGSITIEVFLTGYTVK